MDKSLSNVTDFYILSSKSSNHEYCCLNFDNGIRSEVPDRIYGFWCSFVIVPA
ncbi:unnamed protein product [Brugia timori]|uniref:Uncharacterized protein n=1 Tax=Brugia timori TaxID=42155 RepID=A0A0R3QL97_9BILA|nr:unnamed protein product [Brugia timori]